MGNELLEAMRTGKAMALIEEHRKTLSDAFEVVRARRQAVEEMLRDLRKAETVLARLAGPSAASELPRKQRTKRTARGGTLTAEVLAAVRELGKPTSPEVIARLERTSSRQINRGSVRSILAVSAQKGELVKEGNTWRTPSGDNANGKPTAASAES